MDETRPTTAVQNARARVFVCVLIIEGYLEAIFMSKKWEIVLF